jgi:hypothetical protein
MFKNYTPSMYLSGTSHKLVVLFLGGNSVIGINGPSLHPLTHDQVHHTNHAKKVHQTNHVVVANFFGMFLRSSSHAKTGDLLGATREKTPPFASLIPFIATPTETYASTRIYSILLLVGTLSPFACR